MKRNLILSAFLAFAFVACGGKSGGGTMPTGGGAAPRQAATVKGKVAKGGKKHVTHVVAMPKARKGHKAPKPIRIKVRDDGSYELPVYYGYSWAIVYESEGKKVGAASFKNKSGKPSYAFNLTDNTKVVNNYFDLGVYTEGDGYWFETEHSPYEYYDTDGDGQTDFDDDDDDNDGTMDADDADDDGDGFDDADEDFDNDGDGELDFFDADDDNDGTPDAEDADDDGDGTDDAQDDDGDYDDADNDGVSDEYDNDDDGDGVDDAQDNDDDGDGVDDSQEHDGWNGDDGGADTMQGDDHGGQDDNGGQDDHGGQDDNGGSQDDPPQPEDDNGGQDDNN